MNLLLLHARERVGPNRYRVSGSRATHLANVLGAEVGRRVRVGLLEGPTGEGVVVRSGDAFELECALDHPPAPRSDVHLVLAIPRPKMLRRLLPQIAAMGVDRLVLLRSWRVDRAYLQSPLLTPAGYRPLLHDGMMQGRHTREPLVTVERRFRPFMEDRSPRLFGACHRLAAHPVGEPLAGVRLQAARGVVVAVGPEGGWTAPEMESMAAAGFVPTSSGERIWRVETAVVALLAQLDLLRALTS